MIDTAFSHILLSTIPQILITTFLKSEQSSSRHLDFLHCKILLKNKKIGHITDENTFTMCPNYIYWILQVLKDSKASKSLTYQGLLACFFDSNCNSNCHTNHGVVTCADKAHHFYIKRSSCAFKRPKNRTLNTSLVLMSAHIIESN